MVGSFIINLLLFSGIFLYLLDFPKGAFIIFKIRKINIANKRIWLKMDHKGIMLI